MTNPPNYWNNVYKRIEYIASQCDSKFFEDFKNMILGVHEVVLYGEQLHDLGHNKEAILQVKECERTLNYIAEKLSFLYLDELRKELCRICTDFRAIERTLIQKSVPQIPQA